MPNSVEATSRVIGFSVIGSRVIGSSVVGSSAIGGRAICGAVLALLALAALARPASAETFPPLSGRVVDDAQVLGSATREAVSAASARLEAQTTDQLVVATVRSLQGRTVEDYATRLFNRWRLGQRDRDNGVLLLIVPNEHKVRIEVGSGLGGTLSEATAKLIIDNSLLPALRESAFDRAIAAGVDDIVAVLTGKATAWQQGAAAAAAPAPRAEALTADLPSWLSYGLIGAYGVFVGFLLWGAGRLVIRFLRFIGVAPGKKPAWLHTGTGRPDNITSGGGSSSGGGASGGW